jgi:hypothetical protein
LHRVNSNHNTISNGISQLVDNNNQDYARIDKSKGEDLVFTVPTITAACAANPACASATAAGIVYVGSMNYLHSHLLWFYLAHLAPRQQQSQHHQQWHLPLQTRLQQQALQS